MVWIKVDSSLGYSRKLEQAREELGLTRIELVGRLVFLWWWVAEKAPEGVLPKLTDIELAAAAGHRPDQATSFVTALIRAGFIDKTGDGLKIHDWQEWMPDPLYEKLRHERRKISGKMVVNSAENQRKNSGSQHSSSPLENVVLVFETTGKAKTWELTTKHLEEWEGIFPGVNLLLEVKKAKAWTDANPTRRKTAGGMKAFLFRWLEKAQNDTRGTGGGAAARKAVNDVEERERIERERKEQAERVKRILAS